MSDYSSLATLGPASSRGAELGGLRGGVAQRRREGSFASAASVALFCVGSADVVGGVLRFALARAGIAWLSYFPSLLALAVAGSALIYLGVVAGMTRGLYLLIGAFAFYAVYTVLTGLATKVGHMGVGAQVGRVAFALYTWTPFFLGLVVALQRQEDTVLRYAGIWWLMAVTGVVLNRLTPFPWAGSSFEILGQQSEVAREWSTGGMERLAGFSRASFTAANEVLLFGIMLIAGRATSNGLRVLVWVVSCGAIALTTSKAPLAAILVVPAVLFVESLWGGTAREVSAATYWYCLSILVAFMAVMIILPISSQTASVLSENAGSGQGAFLATSSLLDRAMNMWPRAFGLIAHDREAYQWVLGRGLGGIGSAQAVFEPMFVNAADNLFVFLYVTFGIGGVWLLLAMVMSTVRALGTGRRTFRLTFGLAASVAVLGIASNVLESVTPALTVGMLVGGWLRGPTA